MKGKEIAVDATVKVCISKEPSEQYLDIPRKHMESYTNRAGVNMLKYTYWVVHLRGGRTYRIVWPEVITRIRERLDDREVRYIRIERDLVRTEAIDFIEKKTGCTPIEKE